MKVTRGRIFSLSVFMIAVFIVSFGSMNSVKASGYREEAVALAASQVGYHEKETNENLYDFTANAGNQNYNKYASELWVANGVPWGAIFFWWVMANTCVPKQAYPQSLAVTRTWFEERGMWRERAEYTPQPGDYVLMENENKCGIVESVSENSVTYIAGNIDDSVVRKTCYLNDSYIDGYGLIDYEYNKPPEGLDLGESFLAFFVQEDTAKRIKNNGEDVVLWDEEDKPEYKWLFTRQSDGTYIIRSLYDGGLLTVEDAGTKNGSNVYVAPEEREVLTSQKWYLCTLWGGYQFFPQHVPHFALDRGDYYDNRNGKSLKIYCASQSATQFFCLKKIDYYPLEHIHISDACQKNMLVGKKQSLAYSLVPENASANLVTWESSNPSIAEVDCDGTVTAKAEGTVTIFCTSTYDSDIADSVALTVSKEGAFTEQEVTEASTEEKAAESEKIESSTEQRTTEKTTEIFTEKEEESGKKIKKGSRIRDKNCYYKVTSTKSKTVKVVAIRNKKRTSLKIPEKVYYAGKNYKITAIAKMAFKNNKKLKSVTIGNNVKTVGESAFAGCKMLNKITIGKNVTSIGTKAFYGCKKLKQIKIRSSKLKKIGKRAFWKISKNPVVYAPKKKINKYKRLFKGKF